MASLPKILKVFVDADAFVALAHAGDSNHLKAKTIIVKLLNENVQFMTSNYVYAETVTVLSRHLGRLAANHFIDVMGADENGFNIVYVDAAIEKMAIAIFKQQTSKKTSFMDCCHMACVRAHHIDAVFSFDHIYPQNKIPLV